MHVAYVNVFLNLKVNIQGILLLCGLDQSGGSWDHWSSLQSLPLCWRHDWWHQFGGRVESVMWVVSMFCGSTCQLDVTPSDRRPLQVAPAQWEFQVGPASGTWRGKKMLLELLLWYVTIISIQNFLAKNLAYSKWHLQAGCGRSVDGPLYSAALVWGHIKLDLFQCMFCCDARLVICDIFGRNTTWGWPLIPSQSQSKLELAVCASTLEFLNEFFAVSQSWDSKVTQTIPTWPQEALQEGMFQFSMMPFGG